MLRAATPRDAAFVPALWTAPDNASFIVAPEADEIAMKTAMGDLLVWEDAGARAGFATLTEWLPHVWSLPAVAVQKRGTGTGFAMMSAVLDEMFPIRAAHCVALDATFDNTAGLALFRRLGFVREGVWRDGRCRPEGDWVDCVFLALLKHERRAAA